MLFTAYAAHRLVQNGTGCAAGTASAADAWRLGSKGKRGCSCCGIARMNMRSRHWLHWAAFINGLSHLISDSISSASGMFLNVDIVVLAVECVLTVLRIATSTAGAVVSLCKQLQMLNCCKNAFARHQFPARAGPVSLLLAATPFARVPLAGRSNHRYPKRQGCHPRCIYTRCGERGGRLW